MADHSFDRNQEATCYIGDLDTQVTEALLWELCVQCGPVVNVHVPKDKLTQMHMGFGFVEFKGEEDAQKAYEDTTKETNKSINAKVKDITTKTEEKGQAEADRAEATQERDGVMKELEDLALQNKDLHAECDYTLKNFEIRQTARMQEIEALKQAKAILSGAKFSEFLQQI